MCRPPAPRRRRGRSRWSRTAHRRSLTPADRRRPAQGVPLTPVSGTPVPGVVSRPWRAPRWLLAAPRPTMERRRRLRWMGRVGRRAGPDLVGPPMRPDLGWKGWFRARWVLPAARWRGPPRYPLRWPDCRWMAGQQRQPSRRDGIGRQAGLARANPLVRSEAKLEAVRPDRLDARRREPRRRCADLARCCVDLTRRRRRQDRVSDLPRWPDFPGAPRRRKQRRPGPSFPEWPAGLAPIVPDRLLPSSSRTDPSRSAGYLIREITDPKRSRLRQVGSQQWMPRSVRAVAVRRWRLARANAALRRGRPGAARRHPASWCHWVSCLH